MQDAATVRDGATGHQQGALGGRGRRTAMPPNPRAVCGETSGGAETAAAWSLPMAAVGDGSVTHEARLGGGPGEGFLADTSWGNGRWVCRKFQMLEDLPHH